jgi:hypothetical protein
MREKFIDKTFTTDSEAKIRLVNAILAEYQAEGYDLSLRQLYYQMVARGYIENSQKSYKRMGDLVNNARLAGRVDWDMIADRGRETVSPPHWDSPADIVEAAAQSFAIDKWADQENYVEVMVEKQALEGVLKPVCRNLDIRFTANKGYSSSSTMYEAGKRLMNYALKGKTVWIFYLGDHDPSGIDMTRDVTDRLELFSGEDIEVRRLALNYDQIEDLNPPENPAKETDARYSAYVAQFGHSSWELDAIEPRSLAEIVTRAVEGLRDQDAWDAQVEQESRWQNELLSYAAKYRRNGNGAKA